MYRIVLQQAEEGTTNARFSQAKCKKKNNSEIKLQLVSITHLHPDGCGVQEPGTLHADGHRDQSVEQFLATFIHASAEHCLEDTVAQRLTRLVCVEVHQRLQDN